MLTNSKLFSGPSKYITIQQLVLQDLHISKSTKAPSISLKTFLVKNIDN